MVPFKLIQVVSLLVLLALAASAISYGDVKLNSSFLVIGFKLIKIRSIVSISKI